MCPSCHAVDYITQKLQRSTNANGQCTCQSATYTRQDLSFSQESQQIVLMERRSQIDCWHSYEERCYSRKRERNKQQSEPRATEELSENKPDPTGTGPNAPNIGSFGNKLKLGHCHRNYIRLSFMK